MRIGDEVGIVGERELDLLAEHALAHQPAAVLEQIGVGDQDDARRLLRFRDVVGPSASPSGCPGRRTSPAPTAVPPSPGLVAALEVADEPERVGEEADLVGLDRHRLRRGAEQRDERGGGPLPRLQAAGAGEVQRFSSEVITSLPLRLAARATARPGSRSPARGRRSDTAPAGPPSGRPRACRPPARRPRP